MPKPVAATRDIVAATGEVWDLVSSPGHLAECHPFCAANPVVEWPGEGAQDRIVYYGGRRLERRFVRWYEGGGYDIEIGDANGRVADVEWRLTEAGAGTRLSIAITPQMVGGWGRWLLGPVVRPMLQRYLRSVLAGVDYRVTTGRRVTRNQFGSHPWFSPAVV